jgi:ribosomal protein L37AE/L43A
MWF